MGGAIHQGGNQARAQCVNVKKGWSPAKTALRTNEEELLESGIEEGDLDERWSISCKGVLNPWCSGFHEMRATRAQQCILTWLSAGDARRLVAAGWIPRDVD